MKISKNIHLIKIFSFLQRPFRALRFACTSLFWCLYKGPYVSYFQSWNLSKVPCVTPRHSCSKISEWGQTLIEYTYLLFGMTPMIRSLNFLNRFPWSGLVIKSTIIPFVGHHYTVTSFLFIRSATKNNSMFMWLVLFIPESLPFLSISM